MKKTNPVLSKPFSSTVRALGRSPIEVATTIAVGSGSTPRSLAAKASLSQLSNNAYGSAGATSSSRCSPS